MTPCTHVKITSLMRREYPTGAGLRAPTLSTKSLTKSEASGPSPDGMQYSIILSLKGENCENRSSDDTQDKMTSNFGLKGDKVASPSRLMAR